MKKVAGRLTRKQYRQKPQALEDEDDDEDEIGTIRPKRRGVKRIRDDSDDEYEPETNEPNDVEDDNVSSGTSSKVPKLNDFKSPGASIKALSFKTPKDKMKTFQSTSSVKKGQSFLTPATSSDVKRQDRVQKFKEKNEQRYSWLENVQDAERRPVGHPDYDPRTLYIPDAARRKFTDFERQFWEIKANHWDTVVFFKKGKFYELYEKDADIGHQEFDLKLTDRVNMRMVGVPESHFSHWAAQFVAKGYKVAKVDQMETSIGKSLRERNEKSKKEKVIRRELQCILTKGTLVDSAFLTDDMSTFCMCIKEELDTDNAPPKFGVCFVDTSTAEIGLSSFTDDVDRTQLETLILQLKPKELVLEKGRVSQKTARILKNNLNNPQTNYLVPEKEFWDMSTTLDELSFGRYFQEEREQNEDDDMEVDDQNGSTRDSWPEVLQQMSEDSAGMSALGGLVSYLRTLKLDKDMLSARNFHAYDPVRHSGSLVLDGQTLLNLEVFENSTTGNDEGTLFKLLNHCSTPFGKRLFKRSVEAINDRLNAVDDLNELVGVQEIFNRLLRTLPDLERIISRVHSGNCRVKEFTAALGAFERLLDMVEEVQPYLEKSTSKRLLDIFEHGFPETIAERLKFFKSAFDHQQALEEDTILLHSGFDSEYDAAEEAVQSVMNELEAYRKQQERKLGCKIAYKDIGKEIFQLEVPSKIKVPKDWMQMSKTQAVNRYWTSDLKNLVNEILEAREIRDDILTHDEYTQSLTRITRTEPVCRPEFVKEGPSVLELETLRHPCFMQRAGSDFIPNDTHLGGSESNMILLTGPNMGGKSTLLRQTCIAVIMAQLGCYVPATKCRISPFDRIFTRIGANDNILAGQSTFMVELSETSKILKEATPRSLVILDELGRGTSTFDGFAIAYSVLHYLLTQIRCLGLFSTHYGMLTEEYKNNPLVQNMHMSFFSDEDRREVTFLYKLVRGVCPKSYGMNVASMAGVPMEIVDHADSVAREFQKNQKIRDVRSRDGFTPKMNELASFSRLMNTVTLPTENPDRDLLRALWSSVRTS
ncbi:DNA mismatch repair protein msh6 [Quaeritorhiza haematococci]|nr:DNA mismatch repair protein msh6 [Quaeritorhiza haematococci]